MEEYRSGYRILVADDDVNVHHSLNAYFKREGYQLLSAYNGEEALQHVQKSRPDMVILDIMMPGMDGLMACREIRKESNIPIIMLSAKSEEFDKLLGLELGADDYITKPFVPVEVLARVRSQLRRYAKLGSRPEEGSATLTIGGIALDDRTKSVAVEGEEVSLTPTEYAILRLLMANPGKVYSTKLLYESVWQEAALGSEGAVAVHIRHLREKIEINPSEPRYLKVVWGQGYKMEGGK